MATFNLANLIKVSNAHANIDHFYGPYSSVNDALNAIPSVIRRLGKTVGILENNSTKIVEYWFEEEDANGDLNLVPKHSEIDVTDYLADYLTESEITTLLEDYYTKIEIDEMLANLSTGGDATLQELITANLDVGNINAGTDLEQGLSFTDFVRKLVQTTYEPTFVNPNLNLTTSQTGTKEVGTSLTVDLTANYNAGAIKGDIVNGVWVFGATQAPRAGEASTYAFNGGATQATNTTSFAHTVTQGQNTFTALVNHDAGVQPLDSEGANFDSPYPAGTLNDDNSQLVGRYKQFHGAIDVPSNPPATAFPDTSAEVRALPFSNFDNSNTFTIYLSETGYTIALPSSKTLQSVITQNNETITADFSLVNVTVNDAGGNGVNYNVYNFSSDLALEVNATVTVSNTP